MVNYNIPDKFHLYQDCEDGDGSSYVKSTIQGSPDQLVDTRPKKAEIQHQSTENDDIHNPDQINSQLS
jgi:hypothetical protein